MRLTTAELTLIHGDRNGPQQAQLAHQDLRNLRATIHVAEKVATRLGTSQVLQPSLPPTVNCRGA